jgi:hypothetical protein
MSAGDTQSPAAFLGPCPPDPRFDVQTSNYDDAHIYGSLSELLRSRQQESAASGYESVCSRLQHFWAVSTMTSIGKRTDLGRNILTIHMETDIWIPPNRSATLGFARIAIFKSAGAGAKKGRG